MIESVPPVPVLPQTGLPYLSHRHTNQPTVAQQKAARTAMHTIVLPNTCARSLAATGGSTSTEKALHHLTLNRGWRPPPPNSATLSEMGATARGEASP
ncbi:MULTISPECIES: hypothetical protein [unclassified Streptomyces]|uniref:hypothetical protein n=1 Tax=unclassified Streptomyces TaxID=2593676 RepID=UPI001319FCCC|nr:MULTISPECIES: hypothetical protein [unclassified Streptomyces]MYQ82028.1 hypothetical protein [Streptomyces sp. SID4923]